MALGTHVVRERGSRGRRRLAAGLAAAVVASGLALAAPVAASAEPPAAGAGQQVDDGPADGLLVRFDDSAPARAVERAVAAAGGTIEDVVGSSGFVRVSTGTGSAAAVQAALARSAVVEVVEPNRIRRAAAVPNDAAYAGSVCLGCPPQERYLQAMRFPEAWNTTTGNDSMVLAIIDSGVEFGHSDLAGRLWTNPGENCSNGVDDDRNGYPDDCRGWDFVNNDASPDDDMGHGTMVAGIAGAVTQNGQGVAGATWRGRIMPIKVLDSRGSASDFNIARGIEYAVNNGATVINLSLGGPGQSDTLQNAVNYATSRNVVVVAAAGNDGGGSVATATEPHYPAACSGVISVGATNTADPPVRASFSSYGSPSNPWVDVVAPGEVDGSLGILSTIPVRSYGHRHGTSFSSPLVAAVAFLMRSADPNAGQATITDRLLATARDIGAPGFDAVYGFGFVDASAAVGSVSGNFSTASSGGSGYWMLGERGAVYRFGGALHLGDAATVLSGGASAADLEPTPSGDGYWIVDTVGNVFGFGDARYFGGAGGKLRAGEQVTSISATPGGNGYWLFTTAGRVFAFNAPRLGDLDHLTLNGPILDSIPTPSGNGYFMVASDGGIFAFGDATFLGSMGGHRLNAPVQSLVPDPDGHGYWLVASDGGVFAFHAPFRGSLGRIRLNAPIAGMVPFGNGYLMVGTDGGAFNFSDQQFSGSLVGSGATQPIVAIAAKAATS